jgi:hypothetical protein
MPIPTIIIGVKVWGTYTFQQIEKEGAPSISAASPTEDGIPKKNCLRKNIVYDCAKPGNIKTRIVSVNFKVETTLILVN